MFRIVSLGMLAVYWIAIFVGTHVPHGVHGVGRVNDKVLHFGAYAGLAFLLAAALTSMRVRFGSLLLPIAIAAIYGCVDELSQMAVAGRHAEFTDWAADVFGAGLGVSIFCVVWLIAGKLFARQVAIESDAITKSAA
jgi:VanZ family protein